MYNIDEIKKKIEKEYNENRVKMDNLKEKIEESTRYELEIEKLEISNKILKETCKELDKKTSPLFTNFNKNDDKSIILSNIDNIKEDLNKKKQR